MRRSDRALSDAHRHPLSSGCNGIRRGPRRRRATRPRVGVRRILVPAVETAGFDRTAAVVQRYSCCRPAYGSIRFYVDRAQPGDLELLRHRLELAESSRWARSVSIISSMAPIASARASLFSGQLELARVPDCRWCCISGAPSTTSSNTRRIRVREASPTPSTAAPAGAAIHRARLLPRLWRHDELRRLTADSQACNRVA